MTDKSFEDPLGFTKQTAFLLKGLGGSNIVEEFKKRNISTDELAKLTEDDLLVLGVEKNEAKQLLKQLKQLEKKKLDMHWLSEHKYGINGLKHFIGILKDGQRQLSLIETYLAYLRLKLLKDRNKEIDDYLISQALSSATSSVFKELQYIKKELSDLKNNIFMEKKTSKYKYLISGLLISSLGLTGSIMLYVHKR